MAMKSYMLITLQLKYFGCKTSGSVQNQLVKQLVLTSEQLAYLVNLYFLFNYGSWLEEVLNTEFSWLQIYLFILVCIT